MKIPSFFDKVVNIGIHPSLDAIEQKKTRVLNFLVSLGLLHSAVFILINLAEGHYWNVGLLTLNIMGSLVFLMVNYYSYCLLYTSPSPRDVEESRMPSSA